MIPATQLCKISAFQLFSFSAITSIALAAWMSAGYALLSRADLDIPLNPMGINGSPYGEVFAMAMQSPIDDYFHAGTNGHIHAHGHDEHGHDEHGHDEHGHNEHGHDQPPPLKDPNPSLISRFRTMLVSLSQVPAVRTNPKAASGALKRQLRREVENKLRFAYHLDPSHYANYNSLHFFLTEPAFGTRPELTPSAYSLARETIDYCLKKYDDPRPALTAAAACTNILQLMFQDRNSGGTRYSTANMREILALLDRSISRYETLAHQWKTTGNWELLSPQRTQECLERYEFILKIRNASESAIAIYEGKQSNPQDNH